MFRTAFPAIISRPVETRRRFLIGAAIAAVAFGLNGARADTGAATPVPRALLEFDSAALKLFDAAHASRWGEAHKALGDCRILAGSIDALEPSFTKAGGTQSGFFATTNQLSADLIDASAALSVYDRPWLLGSTENLLARAGDLTEPYAPWIEGTVPRLEVLLVLARRMRQAPKWDDKTGFATADRAFDRLWPGLRDDLSPHRSQLVMRVDAARAGVSVDPSSANVGTLYAAVRDLLGAVAIG